MSEVRLAIDQITPGMRLAESVRNEAGVTLMPAGIRLTPMFIIRLKKWDVRSLLVTDEAKDEDLDDEPPRNQPRPTSSSGQLSSSAFARNIATEVTAWFANVQKDPLMLQLKALAMKKLVAHGEDGIVNVMRREDNLAAEEKP